MIDADLADAGDRDAEFKGDREEMIQMVLGMAQDGFAGPLVMGGIQHQFGLAWPLPARWHSGRSPWIRYVR